MPAIPLRRRLLLLVAAGILPLAAMAGIGLYALADQQRAQLRNVGLELARSVATAIDAQLRSSTSVLQALATTLTLDRDDLHGFRERARRVLALQPDWEGIVLSDPAGAPLVDTRLPPDSRLPPPIDEESFAEVARRGAPVVGNLALDERGEWLFAVRVPVVRGEELRYVLTALVSPDTIHSLLDRQRVPPDWVISIVDARGLRVARSRAHAENLGGRLSESVRAVVDAGGAEGFGLAHSLEGERIYAPYSRLAPGGWTAVLGIPAEPAESAVYRSLAAIGGSVVLSLFLGAVAASRVARGINRPMADLRASAQALGRRETPHPPQTSILEIREVAAAIAAAAEELSKGEAERDELLRKERLAREAAETADRSKDEFMALLSHELRTPLNAVYGWARLLQSGEVKGEAMTARALDAIVRNADVQVQLIDDLLDLSRIAAGKMRLEVRLVDLTRVLQGALDAVRPAAEAKGIPLRLELDPKAGPVTGDAARLQQVAWNLLMNAVKFTPRGGEVRVRLARADSQVRIEVSDTGEGIAPEMLPLVFERFRQADSSSTRTHGGLGLGLALVKHLVELHGGTVVARSGGSGQGSTFVVELPAAIPDAPAGWTARPSPGPAGGSLPGIVRLDGVRVLVADDDRDAVAVAEAILARAGAEVRTCFGAHEVLDLLPQWRPDVLVSDIEMPEVDGYSLIQKVRSLAPDEGGRTPAVALTAYGRMQDRQRALAAGYNMHVPKPVDPGEFTAIIAGIVFPPA